MPVYMIQAGGFGYVKIGVAADPLARKRQLQTSMPQKLRIVRVLEGDREEERALHERFSDQRRNGEWFEPTEEMLIGDLGLPDLPIPTPKRTYLRDPDPKTAWGRWKLLQSDLFEAIGGEEIFAKALGMPPWFVNSYNCHVSHLWALVALARQSGAPITIREALDIRDVAETEQRVRQQAEEKASTLLGRQNLERIWIEKNGRDKAWWRLDPVNDSATTETQKATANG